MAFLNGGGWKQLLSDEVTHSTSGDYYHNTSITQSRCERGGIKSRCDAEDSSKEERR